jgi:hypothetical protein
MFSESYVYVYFNNIVLRISETSLWITRRKIIRVCDTMQQTFVMVWPCLNKVRQLATISAIFV